VPLTSLGRHDANVGAYPLQELLPKIVLAPSLLITLVFVTASSCGVYLSFTNSKRSVDQADGWAGYRRLGLGV
jgi:hypothetical protein